MSFVNVEMNLVSADSISECDEDWAESMTQLFLAETSLDISVAMQEAAILLSQLKEIDCGQGVDTIHKDSQDTGVQFTFSNEGEEFCETPLLASDSQLARQFEALMGDKLPGGGFEPKW